MKKSSDKFTKRTQSSKSSKQKAASKKNKKPITGGSNKAAASEAKDNATVSESTKKTPIRVTTNDTLISENAQKKSTSEVSESKPTSVTSEIVATSEIVDSSAITQGVENIPKPESTMVLITSESMNKIPIAAMVEKKSTSVSLNRETAAGPGEDESMSENLEDASVKEQTGNAIIAKTTEATPASKAFRDNPILKRIEELSIPEFIKDLSILERIKRLSVSVYDRSVSIYESIRVAPTSDLTTSAPISGTVENVPVSVTIKKASQSEVAKKNPILEPIRKLSASGFIRTEAIFEHIKSLSPAGSIHGKSISKSIKKIPLSRINDRLAATEFDNQDAALFIRVGVGLLFIIGGCSKLSQLLDPDYATGLVTNYIGTTGYINDLFLTFLFSNGSFLSPWGFLTALSSFELVSGIALVAGFLVRPLALIYAFLLWTFVFSLPVVTTPGIELTVKTYTSPAMFVQARDIALSGMMFVLYQLGSGRRSLDALFVVNANQSGQKNWDNLGLLLRLSVALPLLIGALFGSFGNIMTFASPGWILLVVSLLLIAGVKVRDAAAITMIVMVWYIMTKLTLDKSFIGNLNGFKRELALFSGALVLFGRGGGNSYTPVDFARRIRAGLGKTSSVSVEAI